MHKLIGYEEGTGVRTFQRERPQNLQIFKINEMAILLRVRSIYNGEFHFLFIKIKISLSIAMSKEY